MLGISRPSRALIGDEQKDLVSGVGPRVRGFGYERRRSGDGGSKRFCDRHQNVRNEGEYNDHSTPTPPWISVQPNERLACAQWGGRLHAEVGWPSEIGEE